MNARFLAALALLAAAALTGAVAAQQATVPPTVQPGLQWSEDQLKKVAHKVRAGRKLTPKSWPNGARVAVALSFDPDAFTPQLSRGDRSPVGMSRGEYFVLTGVPRILQLADKHAIPLTWYIPAVTAMIYPELVQEIKKRPHHEVGLHGWIHEDPRSLGPTEEWRLITQSVDLLAKQWGRRPVGSRAPLFQMSTDTLSLLQRAGVIYDTSLQALDEPYEILIDGKSSGIIELPANWILDDGTFVYATGALPSPRLITRVFRDDFDRAYREGTLFVLTMHPDGMGQRSRLRHLEELIIYMKSKPGVWFATGEQIARYVAEQAGMKVGAVSR